MCIRDRYYNADTLMLLYEDMKAKILGVLGDYELVFVDDCLLYTSRCV